MEAADAEDSAALGAAFQAAVGVGAFADHAAAGRNIWLPITVAEPDRARQRIYDSVYDNVRPAALDLVPSLNANLLTLTATGGTEAIASK
jgi:sugar (pentulose or hexulose) kinase